MLLFYMYVDGPDHKILVLIACAQKPHFIAPYCCLSIAGPTVAQLEFFLALTSFESSVLFFVSSSGLI